MGADREYRTGMTAERALLLACVLLTSAFLGGYGVYVNGLWPGRGLVYFVPAIALAVAVSVHVGSRSSRWVLLSSKGIAFNAKGRRVQLAWSAVDVFNRPQGRRWFRETRVGTGEDLFLLDSLSFPDYDEIVGRLDAVLQQRFDRYSRTIDMSR